MKRALKIVLVLAAVLVVLAVAIPMIAVRVVDPNDYRERIAAEVEAATGRTLTIPGDLSLSFFPWLGIETGAIELGNASGFGDRPFARIEELQVRVRLAPLLGRELQMDTVRIRGLALNLARNAEGRGNWEDLAPRDQAAGSEAGKSSPLAALAVGGVAIADARIRWDDAVGGEQVTIEHLDIDTGAIAPGHAVDARIAFDANARQAAIQAQVKLATSIALDPDGASHRANDLELEATLSGAALGERPLAIQVGGDLVFDVPRQQLRIAPLRIAASGIERAGLRAALDAKGTLAADLAGPVIDLNELAARLRLEGAALGDQGTEITIAGALRADPGAGTVALPGLQVRMPGLTTGGFAAREVVLGADIAANLERQVVAASGLRLTAEVAGTAPGAARAHIELRGEARADLASGDLRAPGLALAGTVSGVAPGEPLPFAVKGDLAFDADSGTITTEQVRLGAAGVKGTAKLAATTGANPKLTATVAVTPFDLRALLGRLGIAAPTTADPGALAGAALQAQVEADAKHLRVHALQLALGGSRIGGEITLPDLAAGKARFDLRATKVDVDRYLPPKAGHKTGHADPVDAAAAVAGAEAAIAALPRDTLRALDLEGRLRIDQLRVRGIEMRRFDFPLTLRAGVLDYSAVKVESYGGTITANGRLDLAGPGIVLTQHKNGRGIVPARLLAALGVTADLGALGAARADFDSAGRFEFDAASHRAAVKDLTLAVKLAGKGLPKPGITARLAASAVADLAKQTATVPSLDLRLGKAHLAGKLALTQILGDLRYAGNLELDAFSPRALLASLGQPAPATADRKALGRADAVLTFSGTPDTVRIDPLALGVDDTKASGSIEITSFADPGYRFDLDVDALDADRYLPPEQAGAKAATPGTATAALPIEQIRALDLDGEMRIGKLRIAGLTLGAVRVRARSKDGELRLLPLDADLYQGRYQGDVRIDARGKVPLLSANERLTGIETGPLLRDLQGTELMSGRGDVTLVLDGRGADVEALKRSLDGRATFIFRDGAIYGVNVLGTLCKAFSGISMGSLRKKDLLSGLLGMALPALGAQAGAGTTDTANRTEFAELSASLDIRDGIATNQDLLLRSPLVRVEGAGNADLPGDRVRYTATAALVASCQGQGGRDFSELRGIPIPIHVTGRLSEPSIQPPSLQEVAAAVQRLRTAPATAQQPQYQSQPSATAPPPAPKPRDAGKEALQQILNKGLRGLLGQ